MKWTKNLLAPLGVTVATPLIGWSIHNYLIRLQPSAKCTDAVEQLGLLVAKQHQSPVDRVLSAMISDFDPKTIYLIVPATLDQDEIRKLVGKNVAILSWQDLHHKSPQSATEEEFKLLEEMGQQIADGNFVARNPLGDHRSFRLEDPNDRLKLSRFVHRPNVVGKAEFKAAVNSLELNDLLVYTYLPPEADWPNLARLHTAIVSPVSVLLLEDNYYRLSYDCPSRRTKFVVVRDADMASALGLSTQSNPNL